MYNCLSLGGYIFMEFNLQRSTRYRGKQNSILVSKCKTVLLANKELVEWQSVDRWSVHMLQQTPYTVSQRFLRYQGLIKILWVRESWNLIWRDKFQRAFISTILFFVIEVNYSHIQVIEVKELGTKLFWAIFSIYFYLHRFS